jgi:hypothetical protein
VLISNCLSVLPLKIKPFALQSDSVLGFLLTRYFCFSYRVHPAYSVLFWLQINATHYATETETTSAYRKRLKYHGDLFDCIHPIEFMK